MIYCDIWYETSMEFLHMNFHVLYCYDILWYELFHDIYRYIVLCYWHVVIYPDNMMWYVVICNISVIYTISVWYFMIDIGVISYDICGIGHKSVIYDVIYVITMRYLVIYVVWYPVIFCDIRCISISFCASLQIRIEGFKLIKQHSCKIYSRKHNPE